VSDDDLPEVQCQVDTDSDDTLADWHEYSGAGSTLSGHIVFPFGIEAFANEVGAIAIRIPDKGGEIEILTELGKPRRQVDKATGDGKVATIKPAPRRTD
jgi:hypothetical protein